jgi:hypothetical protein
MDMEYNMSKPEISIIDASTGEQIVREMTTAEHNEYKKYVADSNAEKETAKLEADTKAAEKLVLLEKLGITADEAKLLLG